MRHVYAHFVSKTAPSGLGEIEETRTLSRVLQAKQKMFDLFHSIKKLTSHVYALRTDYRTTASKDIRFIRANADREQCT